MLSKVMSVLRIQAMHGGQGLQVHCVAGVRDVGESRLRRMHSHPQGVQRLRAGDAIGRHVMRALELLDCCLRTRAEVAVRMQCTAVCVGEAQFGEICLQRGDIFAVGALLH